MYSYVIFFSVFLSEATNKQSYRVGSNNKKVLTPVTPPMPEVSRRPGDFVACLSRESQIDIRVSKHQKLID